MDRRTASIIGAIIGVGGLIAFAGDLNPPKGPIEPTMHTLDEIHDLVESTFACGRCTWKYVGLDVSGSQDTLAVPGSGMLHGIWIGRASGGFYLEVWNETPQEGALIGTFHLALGASQFFQLDVTFESGLYLRANASSEATVLYRG